MPTSASSCHCRNNRPQCLGLLEAKEYGFCDGTDLPTAPAIFREMVIRPTVPGTGLGATCDADFPPTCLYSQAAVGDMDLSTVKQAVERELKIPLPI
eukprot:s109_g5.t1